MGYELNRAFSQTDMRDVYSAVRVPALLTHDLKGCVAGDGKEPCAGMSHLAPSLQGMPGAHERLLQCVLAAGRARDAPAARKQRRPMTLDEHLKGAFVPELSQSEQALVRLVPCERPRTGWIQHQLHRSIQPRDAASSP